VMPRDGSELAVVNRSIFMEPLLGDKQALFDPVKLSWIGNIADETSVCVSWHSSKIKTWNDLFSNTFVVAANSMSADTGIYGNVLKHFFGAKIRIVVGYPGGAQINQAIENGEVDGRCGWSWSAARTGKPDWIADKSINILVQLGLKSDPQLKDVPVIYDLATTDEQRQALRLVLQRQDIAWPIMAPPGIPADRLHALQTAFDATMEDPQFLDIAGKIGIDVRPKTGAEVTEVIRALYQTPPAIVEDVKKALNP
jgi:tripartite-type tricarboxylate transporter receptor subunit TctC